MTLYPEVLRRAQEELDHVLGKDVLPTFEDRKNLPYIVAIVNECLRYTASASVIPIAFELMIPFRWEVVVPLGAPFPSFWGAADID